MVIVYDGKVVVTPYDDQGIKYDQEVVLTAGESFSSRDGIKKIQKNIEQP